MMDDADYAKMILRSFDIVGRRVGIVKRERMNDMTAYRERSREELK